jgi:hypothetical protein
LRALVIVRDQDDARADNAQADLSRQYTATELAYNIDIDCIHMCTVQSTRIVYARHEYPGVGGLGHEVYVWGNRVRAHSPLKSAQARGLLVQRRRERARELVGQRSAVVLAQEGLGLVGDAGLSAFVLAQALQAFVPERGVLPLERDECAVVRDPGST